MSKVAIVFWSATGNTETMANCIAEGAGANGTIVPCAEMTPQSWQSLTLWPLAARLWVQSSWRRASSSLCLLRWKAL